MAKTIDIVFGVKGGSSINGESGQLILGQLQEIVSEISRDPSKRDMLVLGVNATKTKIQITNQLNDMIKTLKLDPINLDVLLNGKKYNGTGGTGGGSSGGGGKYNAENMINGVNNYLIKNQSKMTTEEIQHAQLLSELMKTEGADLADLSRKWKTFTAENSVAMKERAEEARATANTMVKAANERLKQEKAAEAEITRQAKKNADERKRDAEQAADLSAQYIEKINNQVSGLNSQGLLSDETGLGFAQRFKDIQSQMFDAGKAGDLQKVEELKVKWEELNQEVLNYSRNITAGAKQSQMFDNLSQYLNKFGDALKKNDPEVYQRLVDIRDRLAEPGTMDGTKLKKLTEEIERLKGQANASLNPLQRFVKMFKQRFTSIAMTTAVMLVRKAIRELVNDVVTLDKCVTDLQIASGKSRDEVEAMVRDYSKLAKELGTTTQKVAEGADTWLRQGYSASEAETLLADSTKLAVLGQLEAKEASTALTSAMKGYKVSVEDAIGIVDKFTAVDMKAAASAGDIATAMSETAVSANVAGVSMDKLIGYLTVVKEVTQDGAESVGTFYKTLFARMGNIKAGKYVSDEGEDLNDTEKVLKKNGILLRDSTNEFRDFGDVLDEVAGKWDKYDNVTQHAIATAFAGTRQQEKFFVLMENYGKALEYETVAAESAGTANQKYTDAYLDSIEARKNAMKAAFESLSQTVLDSEVIKVFYSVLTGIITAIDKILSSGVGVILLVETIYAILAKLVGALKAGTGVFAVLNTLMFQAEGITWAVAVKQMTLSGAIKVVTKELWKQIAAWIASKGWIAIVIAAIAAVVVIVAKVIKKLQEVRQANKDALAEIRQDISNTTSEFESLENKIADVTKRIKELKANPLKNIADWQELETLTRQLSTLEDRLKRAEEKANRLKNEEYEKYVSSTPGLSYMIDGKEHVYTPKEMATGIPGNLDTLLLWFQAFQEGRIYTEDGEFKSKRGSPGDNTRAKKATERARELIDDLVDLRGDLEYIDNAQTDLEKQVNERIIATDKIFDIYDIMFGDTSDLFDRILNRAYYSTAKTILSGIASEEDLKTLYDSNSYVKDFIDYIVQLYGLNLEDGGFTYIFNSLNTISEAVEDVVKRFESLYDTLTGEGLKEATDAVETLADAIEEMDSAGKISLGTAEKLAEMGEEYTEAIIIQNGQIRVNSALLRGLAIEKLEAAKNTAILNGATAETIALYDKLIEDTKTLGSSEAVDRANGLIDYENEILEYAGGYSYDQRRLENIDRQRQNILKQIEYYRSKGFSSDSDEIMNLYKQYIKYGEQMIKLNDDLSQQEDETIKAAIEAENDELEKQKDLYDDIIDARKKALDLMKEEADYQKNLAAKQKKVSDLQTQLAAARLDTSASGRARVRQLEEKLSEAQEDLDEFNLEHAVDIINDQLEAEQEENERLYEQQKADNDARLDQLLADNADARAEYAANLKEETDIVGDALGDIWDEFDPNAEGTVGAMIKNIEATIQTIESKIGEDNVEHSLLYGLDFPDLTDERQELIEDFKQRKNKNKYVAQTIDWNSLIEQFKQRRKYHSGGIVDDLSLGDNEVFAKLMKGEYVATPTQMSNFLRKTLPNMTNMGNSQNFNAPLITVTCGSVTEESLPKLESIVKSAADKIKSELTSAFDKTGFRSTNKRILAY